jgi:hypothetical protein
MNLRNNEQNSPNRRMPYFHYIIYQEILCKTGANADRVISTAGNFMRLVLNYWKVWMLNILILIHCSSLRFSMAKL